jgi:hypothetical protein
MHNDVFISYSSRDKPIADALCSTLEQQGIRCWIAPRDILPGQDWSGAIIDAIINCGVMVLVFSSESNNSEQVKRELAAAVAEGKRLIPFRIEDVALSKHMRYFIGTPHWLDALTQPLEQHLGYLARTVSLLLSEGATQSDSPSPSGSSTETIAANQAAVVVPSERQQDSAHEPPGGHQLTRLSFRYRLDGRLRNVCLLSQPIVRLGKERANDIVLRVLPRSTSNDGQTARISRQHAELRLDGQHVEWVNLDCVNGTLIDGHPLPAKATVLLHSGTNVSPGGVLDLACDVYTEDRGNTATGDVTTRLEFSAPHVSAVRLRRLDDLGGFEQYVVFDHRIAIGSSVRCPILILHPSVAREHATIVHSADGFEIEACNEEFPTQVDGQPLEVGDRRLIGPDSRLRVGDVDVEVSEYGQLHLDIPTESA